MNDSISSILVLVMLGLLSLWGIARFAPFLRTDSGAKRRKKHTSHFDMQPVKATPIGKQQMARRVGVRVMNSRQLAVQPIAVAVPTMNVEATSATTQAPPAPHPEVEDHPPVAPFIFGQDLRGINFRGRNLADVDWSHCNLVRANLAGVDLRGAHLAYADFTNAILVGANLSGCDCTGARFHGANLHGATLRDSNLTDTRFGPTQRPWADVYSLDASSRFPWRIIEIVGANLRGVDTTGADCTGSDILGGRRVDDLYWTQW